MHLHDTYVHWETTPHWIVLYGLILILQNCWLKQRKMVWHGQGGLDSIVKCNVNVSVWTNSKLLTYILRIDIQVESTRGNKVLGVVVQHLSFKFSFVDNCLLYNKWCCDAFIIISNDFYICTFFKYILLIFW